MPGSVLRLPAFVILPLVGLIPQNALANQPPEALQLPDYVADLILEKRLGQFTGDFRPLPFD